RVAPPKRAPGICASRCAAADSGRVTRSRDRAASKLQECDCRGAGEVRGGPFRAARQVVTYGPLASGHARAPRGRLGREAAMQGLRSSVIAGLRRPWSWAMALLFVALAGGGLWAAPAVDTDECQRRLEAAIEAVPSHPRVKGVPLEKVRATTEFTTGNMLFVLLHETAHGLISDLGLPVLGREEDAADQFATVTMLQM